MSMEMIGGWALGAYGKAFLDSVKQLIKRKYRDRTEEADKKELKEKLQVFERHWQNFSWGDAAKHYQKHMRGIYGFIRVIGTTEPIPIGDIFTDVYILEKPQAYRRFDMTKLHEMQEEPNMLLDGGKRKRGLKVVVSRRGHRLYILGKPGAGKTTFMKYLVNQTIIASELNKLPIFITLRDWDARTTRLIDFILQQFEICDFPDAIPFITYLLDNGHAIVLFDGLDEVPQEDEQRNKTIQALHNFSKKYLKTQIVITCRVAASDYSFTEFTYIEMADFSTSQVNAYARNWFRKYPDTAEEFLKELKLKENKGVYDLSRSPLLFSMICLSYEETLIIPKRRVELYEEALDALLKKWDASRKIRRDQSYKNLSLGHKRQMFAHIAAEYFDKGEIFLPKKHLAKKIEDYLKNLPPDSKKYIPDGEAILEAISAQHGILVERAKGIYSFSHLTFQEYYTAKYIADNANRGTLKNLMTHLGDSSWREVFLLTASLLYEATPLFEAMHKTAQQSLEVSPKIIMVQRWATQRSAHIPIYQANTKQALYWYLILNLARARNRDRKRGFDLVSALEFARSKNQNQNRALTLARALEFSLTRDQCRTDAIHSALMLISTLHSSLTRESDFILADSLSSNFSFMKADMLDLNLPQSFVHNLSHARQIAHAIDTNIALGLDKDIEKATTSLFQNQQSFGNGRISFDIQTLILVLFSNTFIFLPKKELSKERIEKLQTLISAWQNRSPTSLDNNKKLLCPHYQAPRQEWLDFNNHIRDIAGKILDIDLSIGWSMLEYQAVLAYLEANSLFWDCLKIANIKNRTAFENMILNVPEGREIPSE